MRVFRHFQSSSLVDLPWISARDWQEVVLLYCLFDRLAMFLESVQYFYDQVSVERFTEQRVSSVGGGLSVFLPCFLLRQQ